MNASAEPPPFLRVVHGGDPSPDEVAALVAALRLVAGRTDGQPPERRSSWADRAAGVRTPLRTGPGAWRASGRAPGTRTRAGW
jgi:hypothetical protein